MSKATVPAIFTTGQVAKICQVAPRTVSKWFDTGVLKGYRIPGSKDRRIPREHLLRFMREHGMPVDALLSGTGPQALLIGLTPDAQVALSAQLQRAGIRVHGAQTSFDAGVIAKSLNPRFVVIDAAIGRELAESIVAVLRQNDGGSQRMILGLLSAADRAQLTAAASFTEILQKPVDLDLVAEKIRSSATRAAASTI